jgi:hypothetical protein
MQLVGEVDSPEQVAIVIGLEWYRKLFAVALWGRIMFLPQGWLKLSQYFAYRGLICFIAVEHQNSSLFLLRFRFIIH